MAKSKNGVGRRGFLKNAAAGAAGAAALVTSTPLAEAQAPASNSKKDATPAGAPAPTEAQLFREAGNIRPPVEVRTITRPGSDLMVQTLRDLGIEFAAANPGSSFEGFQESVINYGHPPNVMPEWITALHEESAVTMAHGYAKAEGKPMLAVLHGTIGIQHAAMSIYQAYYDRVPVLMFAGNDVDFIPAHTAHDMAGMVRSYTKWDAEPKTVDEALVAIQRAYNEANTPPMGPTLVVLSSEIQKENSPNTRIPAYKPPQFPSVDATTAREIAKALVEAQNPRIAVGRLRTPEGVKRAVELAELVGACTSTAATQGPMSFPQRHPLCGPGADTNYDYTLGLETGGAQVAINGPGLAKVAAERDVTHIDYGGVKTPSNFGRGAAIKAAMPIEADAEASLPLIIDEVKRQLTPRAKNADSGTRGQTRAGQSRRSRGSPRAGGGASQSRMERQPYQHRAHLCRALAAHHARRLVPGFSQCVFPAATTRNFGITTSRIVTSAVKARAVWATARRPQWARRWRLKRAIESSSMSKRMAISTMLRAFYGRPRITSCRCSR